MSGLTTHILDLTQGKPACDVKIELYFTETSQGEWQLLKTAVTNLDGRLNQPLLSSEEMQIGYYELCYHISDYFKSQKIELPNPPFLDIVPIRFGISSIESHYHVPLLISPYGYQTYRGS